MTPEVPDCWEVADGDEIIRWTPARVVFEDPAFDEYANLPHGLFDAAVDKRLAQRGMRAVPIRPTPDPACIEAAHVVAGAMTKGEWIDMRTLKTNGCQRCADFWGDIRDAT